MQQANLESLLPYLWITGRSSRREWWRVHLFCALLLFVYEQMYRARMGSADGDGLSKQAVAVLWWLAASGLTWISWASVVRRLHDRGKSGWWSLLYLVPGIGWLWLIIECGFLPSRAPATTIAPVPERQSAPRARPREPRRAARAPLSAAPRVGTIQRMEHRPWTSRRALKLAGNVIGLIILGIVLYAWFFDRHAVPFFEGAFERPAKVKLAE